MMLVEIDGEKIENGNYYNLEEFERVVKSIDSTFYGLLLYNYQILEDSRLLPVLYSLYLSSEKKRDFQSTYVLFNARNSPRPTFPNVIVPLSFGTKLGRLYLLVFDDFSMIGLVISISFRKFSDKNFVRELHQICTNKLCIPEEYLC